MYKNKLNYKHQGSIPTQNVNLLFVTQKVFFVYITTEM